MVFAAFRTMRLRRDVLHHVKTQTRALTAGAGETSLGYGAPKSIHRRSLMWRAKHREFLH
jgi:hypothetical protein